MGSLKIPVIAKSGMRELDQLARTVVDFLAELLRVPMLDGVLIEGQSIAAGTPLSVSHGLGRKVRGWLLVRKRGAGDVWDTQDAQPANLAKTTLTLNASADVSVDVWIF